MSAQLDNAHQSSQSFTQEELDLAASAYLLRIECPLSLQQLRPRVNALQFTADVAPEFTTQTQQSHLLPSEELGSNMNESRQELLDILTLLMQCQQSTVPWGNVSLRLFRASSSSHSSTDDWKRQDPAPCNEWGLNSQGINKDFAFLRDLYLKIVVWRQGGYCHELNSLFCWLLRYLGFDASLGTGRVNTAGGLTPPNSHAIIFVNVLGMKYMVDVGFGVLGTCEPIPIINNRVHITKAAKYENGLPIPRHFLPASAAANTSDSQLAAPRNCAGDRAFKLTIEGNLMRRWMWIASPKHSFNGLVDGEFPRWVLQCEVDCSPPTAETLSAVVAGLHGPGSLFTANVMAQLPQPTRHLKLFNYGYTEVDLLTGDEKSEPFENAAQILECLQTKFHHDFSLMFRYPTLPPMATLMEVVKEQRGVSPLPCSSSLATGRVVQVCPSKEDMLVLYSPPHYGTEEKDDVADLVAATVPATNSATSGATSGAPSVLKRLPSFPALPSPQHSILPTFFRALSA